MKNLLIVDQSDFIYTPVGGSTTFLRTVVPHLCNYFEVSLLGRSNNKSLLGKWTYNYLNSAKFYSIGELNRQFGVPERLKTLYYLHKIISKIDINDFDIYYFHQVETAYPFLNSVNGKKILHLHGLANPLSVSRFSLFRNSAVQCLYLPFFQKVEKGMDALFSVSEVNQNIPSELPISRPDIFNYVPVCIDTLSFSPTSRSNARQSIGIPESEIVFGYVGRISKCKGVEHSIHFISNQVNAGRDVRMIIVGDGEYVGFLKQLAYKLKIAERIHFFSAQAYEVLPSYYNAVDIFLMGSEAEGFPMVVLEALSCGVPILSTDVGAISQVVVNGINGFTLPNFNSSELAILSDRICSDYNTFSSAARASVEPYAAEIIAKKIAELINYK